MGLAAMTVRAVAQQADIERMMRAAMNAGLHVVGVEQTAAGVRVLTSDKPAPPPLTAPAAPRDPAELARERRAWRNREGQRP
ncbi:hypothetical protein [Microcystis phage vB_MweS-yong2]|nr:hypothetical protein [Microcystis phage vB_MweS-yong2]